MRADNVVLKRSYSTRSIVEGLKNGTISLNEISAIHLDNDTSSIVLNKSPHHFPGETLEDLLD